MACLYNMAGVNLSPLFQSDMMSFENGTSKNVSK